MNGEVKIHALQPLGGLGLDESEPFTCRLTWSYPVLEALPIIILFGALFWQRKSKQHNRWIVLAMGMGFCIIWLVQKLLPSLPSKITDVFVPVFQALVYGFCMSCLVSRHLKASHFLGAILKKLFFLACACTLAVFSMSNFQDERIFIPSMVILLIIGVGFLLSWIMASKVCRYVSNLIIFNLSFVVSCLLLITSTVMVLCVASGNSPPLSQVLTYALGLAGMLTITFQPLILILWLIPSQKERLAEMSE